MTGCPRTFGFVLALTVFAAQNTAEATPIRPFAGALSALTWNAPAADQIEDLFKEGVDLLARNKRPEALRKFQELLAANPTQEQAYALWKNTDHQVWLDLLVEQGEFELVAKNLMKLAEAGRAERRNDGEAIKKLLGDLRAEDSLAFRKARNTLASEHGEYAVPYMLPTLAEQGSDDRRVLYMQTLTEMDSDVVVPLIEALNSPDAFLRRNVALVLGLIGDSRAAGMLAHLAKDDADGGVKAAASEALAKRKSSGDALAEFLAQGEAYALRSDRVLAAHQYSDVVWSWSEKGLTSMPVSRSVYGDEMSKKNYARALAVDANSLAARAGLARAYAVENAKLAGLAAAGQDVSAWAALADGNSIALGLIGADAIDAALGAAVRNSDTTAGEALIQALAQCPNAPTAGLMAALGSGDGAMRSEAAVALGRHAVASRSAANPAVIAALGEAAGREVVRTVCVIEPRAAVRDAALAELAKLGFAAHGVERGANALGLLHRVPGVDAVVVAESLPDLTTFQVIDDLRAETRYASTPIFVLADNADAAKELYGERATGVVGASDLSQLTAAVGGLTGDRALADALATQAAGVLGDIAAGGGDISAAVPGLLATLTNREDGVTTAALATLGRVGGSPHVAAITSIVADGARSEAARTAAANALAAIFARGATASADEMTALAGAIRSDAPAGVRNAAARAMGSLRLQADVRAEMLRAARAAQAQN